ncbi:MAG: ABC transporter ATP-binding protein, partial [Desulfurococcaceae archaeon]
KSLVATNGLSAIAAVHDLNLASAYCDKILMMKDGRVFAAGSPSLVLTPENIREVFGVNVTIHSNGGRPCILVC